MIKGKYYTLKKRVFLAAKLLKNHDDDEKNHFFSRRLRGIFSY